MGKTKEMAGIQHQGEDKLQFNRVTMVKKETDAADKSLPSHRQLTSSEKPKEIVYARCFIISNCNYTVSRKQEGPPIGGAV